ncbi:MAG: glycosyltransferase [Ignavibacteria bacterium]|jgi:glycosyltransferase involved in cell wall biosynthesis
MPKISVIIPTYNRASLISESIDSVLYQTYKDFDLIIVDDGSTDNTKEIISRYDDPRVKYEYRENRGVSAARNYGAEMTSADYIIFLDSDDILLENSLEKFVNCLDFNKEVGFGYGQANIMKVGGEVYRVRKSHFFTDSQIIDPVKQIRELIFHKPYTVSTCAMRLSCFNAIGGFNEDMWFAEDWQFFVRLAKRYSAFYIAEPVTNMRVHDNQLQNEVKPGREKAFFSIIKEVFEDPIFAPKVEDIKGQAYCHIYNSILAELASGEDSKLARKYQIMAVRFYPSIIFKRDIMFITYKYFASLLPACMRIRLRNIKHHFKYTLEEQE